MAQIKTAYTFVATTAILLDLKAKAGTAAVHQLYQLACKEIGKKYAAFNSLHTQVKRDNVRHVVGTGMAASPDRFSGAFVDWMKAQTPHFGTAPVVGGRNLFAWTGSAKSLANRKEFKWAVSIYFDGL